MNRRGCFVANLSILLIATVLALPGQAAAGLQRPSYAAGDRWVYVLDGSLRTFPGFNESQLGTFRFDLVGRVEVDVIGPTTATPGGVPTPVVWVHARTSGYLNGTFSIPGAGTAQVTGSFTTSAVELWEDEAYLPVQSNTTASYVADISFIGITTQLVVSTRLDAATTVFPIPPFDLEVGQNATAQLDTHLVANTTVTISGQTMSAENETDVASLWSRQVISQENVSVEAGTFSAYQLNQSLGSFPGISIGISEGGNETAYFSNDVGYYVKRDAYANGTRVAEMRLKSYSYGARPGALNAIDFVLFVAVPVAIAVLMVLLLRRKGRDEAKRSEVAPPEPRDGGGPGAR